MTRVPKFRAWDKTEDEMIDVDEMSWTPNKNGVMEFFGIGNFTSRGLLAREVEIMQSTGLKDDNGMEIYEGDVVVFEDADDIENIYTNQGLIEWCQGGFNVTNRTSVTMEDLLDGDNLEVTIIGNIYENKELLE